MSDISPRNKKTPSLPEDQLPIELWMEVLARLPIKALLKLRCVCKFWRSIIDDPEFISLNLTLSKNNGEKLQLLSFKVLLFGDTRRKVRLTTHKVDQLRKSGNIDPLFSLPDSWNGDCKAYVNGLMLVQTINKQKLMLLNPSIRKSLTLPPCPVSCFTSNIILGFDHLSNDYKVVVLDYMQSLAAIYDLSKGSWRIKFIDNIWVAMMLDRSVFCHGIVYWIPSVNNKRLASFDFATETLNFIDLPSDFGRDNDDHAGGGGIGQMQAKFVFVLGESIALLDTDYKGGCCIWVMEKGNSDQTRKIWSKKWCLDLNLKNYNCTSLFYVEKRNMLISCVGNVVVHCLDVENNKLKRLRKFSQNVRLRFVDAYVESLVLARGGESITNG